MGQPWGRLYSGTRHHRKIRVLRQRCPDSWWVFYPLLEMAFEVDDDGLIYLDPDMAFSLPELAAEVGISSEGALDRTLAIMAELKLIDRENGFIRFASYNDRQFKSDSSAERVRKYRDKQKKSLQKLECNGDVTLQKLECNGDVTPPEQNRTEQIQNRNTPLPPKSGGVPFQKIIDAWNTLKPELLPKAELTDKRKPKIKAAWTEHPSLEWFETLFAGISLSPWHSHRDKWQGCSFDWILKNRTEMREKLDAIKKANGGAAQARDDPKDPFAIPGLLKLDPNCPLCHGDWRNSKEPCSCLHPVEDDDDKPKSEPKTTAPAATC